MLFITGSFTTPKSTVPTNGVFLPFDFIADNDKYIGVLLSICEVDVNAVVEFFKYICIFTSVEIGSFVIIIVLFTDE